MYSQKFQAIIALGSNLGDSIATIKSALEAISQIESLELIKTSSLYKTAPVGFINQPDFVNAVCAVKTTLSPQALLTELFKIEQNHHRIRNFKNGPRTLDLDLIDYEHQIINSESLILPHPRAIDRAFVLIPMAEILPNYYLNETHQKMDMHKHFSSDSVTILK